MQRQTRSLASGKTVGGSFSCSVVKVSGLGYFSCRHENIATRVLEIEMAFKSSRKKKRSERLE